VTRATAPLDFWVTGGGTREPLDAVRWIGNVSTGRMAGALARAAAARGHRVTLFLAEHAPAPRSPRIALVRFVTSADLSRALRARRRAPDVIVHAAAVSDYAPRPQRGKVSSGKASWTVELAPLPKLAPQLRRRHPRAILCLFKLEAAIPRAELVARATRTARAARAQRIFANLLEEVGAGHRGWLIDPARGEATELRSRPAIARGIVRACEALARARGETAAGSGGRR